MTKFGQKADRQGLCAARRLLCACLVTCSGSLAMAVAAGCSDTAATDPAIDSDAEDLHHRRCSPTTCSAKGATCGTISDGCGHILTCGDCSAPATCGGGGVPNACGGGDGGSSTDAGSTADAAADSGGGRDAAEEDAAPSTSTGSPFPAPPPPSVPVNGTKIYVATTGADNASCGSISSPCASLDFVSDNKAAPGSEVVVRGGTYTRSTWFGASGNASAYIWLHPYPGEHVIFDGTSVAAHSCMFNSGGSYLRIEGFEVRNSPGDGICAYDNHFVQIIGNVVHDSQNSGMWVGEDTGQTGTHDVLIQGNTVYRSCLNNVGNTALQGSGGWGQGIAMTGDGANFSTHLNLAAIGNTVFDNWGEGIGFGGGSGATIQGNVVYDNFSTQIYLCGGQDAVIDSNVAYWTGDSRFINIVHGGKPLGLATSIESSGGHIVNNTYSNNLVVGTWNGFRYFVDQGTGGMVNNLIANNTFVNSGAASIQIEANAAHSGNVLVDNIVYSSMAGAVLASGSAGGTSFDHNDWFGGSAGPFAGGSGDLLADPKLTRPNAAVAPGGLVPGNYRPIAVSPIWGTARALPQVLRNIENAPRNGTSSIGAY